MKSDTIGKQYLKALFLALFICTQKSLSKKTNSGVDSYFDRLTNCVQSLGNIISRVQQITIEHKMHVEREARLLELEEQVKKQCDNISPSVPIGSAFKCNQSIASMLNIVPRYINHEFEDHEIQVDISMLKETMNKINVHCTKFLVLIKKAI